ncbi:DNA polymerase III subunit chi [Ahrensia marina]|uniref:DNA polymerase III subunit chi n=1 Tax=Ahrensia marina TaxID=1514904 RepID=A0A0N0VM10_9HYPH|nr:DNA polymerase III subunit chi [Ahrensia marina]KPB02414.1 DNA polymerase III subunit chi [Ahrensia marina]
MTDIVFYHLTETSLDEALPVLVERSLGRQWKVTIQTHSDDVRDRLDARLWEYKAEDFLPHGKDGDPFEADHPVFLTSTDLNQNGSHIRFVVDNAALPDGLNSYERVAIMFDGNDESAVSQARNNWKNLKADGHSLTYWKQNMEGKWERAA